MPAGLETFKSDGTPLTRYTDNLARILGIQAIGTGSGSFSNPGLLTGRPFYIFTSGTLIFDLRSSAGSAIASGSQVTWKNSGPPCSIVYGVY